MNISPPAYSEQQLIYRILTHLDQSKNEVAILEFRQLVADIHAAIPEKQRTGKGITWVLQRAAMLLAQGCAEPNQLRQFAGQIEQQLQPGDRLIGIPILLMADYGLSDPQPAMDYFTTAANSPSWEGREFAQLAFRRLILPHRGLVFPFLADMAQSSQPNQRRFSSETLRPVVENHWLQKEPQASLAVLRYLFREPHPYPRTSVGNNLSDLSRRNPELIFEIVHKLISSGDPNSTWIATRACRNLVKLYPERVLDVLHLDEYHYKDRHVRRGMRSESIAKAILHTLSPESQFAGLEPLPGSYSNSTQILLARQANGEMIRFAVRCYTDFGNYDLGLKAQREFYTLKLLYEHGLPVPRPLLLDAEGTLLRRPGMVSAFVEGEMLEQLNDPQGMAAEMARVLARIHAVPCNQSSIPFLLDANAEALWFLRQGHEPPEVVRSFPHGEAVWRRLLELQPSVEEASPRLVHIDYWPGNLLWQDGKISAVVDFEEAALGDPDIDVAYCRMDLHLRGLPGAAAEFLRVYEETARRKVENLSFWELAACLRPMSAQAGWISESPTRENFIAWLHEIA
jgi:aminoglycoside phosphotransferase (APT) family kinase protein/3-methyladenine DNA glycosylase AlkC